MKAVIGNCEGSVQLRVRPESTNDELAVEKFLHELRDGNASVVVFFEREPGKRAMSINPRKEVTLN